MLKKESKKVIFLIPSMQGGGAERVISVISDSLTKNNISVTIALFKNNIVEYPIYEKVDIDTSLIGKCNSPMYKFISFRRYLKEHKDATFVSFFTMIGMYMLAASIGLNARIIISERLDPAQSIPNKKILFWLRKKLYHYAYGFVFQTPNALNYFNESVQKKGVVIPNPLKEGLPVRFEGAREKRIVTFARLEPQKNYPLLVNAFEKFSNDHEDYILEIYGKGSMEENLKRLVSNKRLENKIKFCGFSSNIHRDILSAKMFVLPSDYEGLSNSMLEALAIGLPCICTDCPPGGARMFIEDGVNGLLIPVGDVDTMANAMSKIAEDDFFAEKLSKNAMLIRDELQADLICKKWEEIIKNS